jgi:hypothetical protein
MLLAHLRDLIHDHHRHTHTHSLPPMEDALLDVYPAGLAQFVPDECADSDRAA